MEKEGRKEGRKEGWGINLIRIIANDKEEREISLATVVEREEFAYSKLIDRFETREDRKRGAAGDRFLISGRAEYSFSLFHLRRVRGIREPTHEHAELSR